MDSGRSRPVNGSGTESGAAGDFLADDRSASPGLGSASIEQPTPVSIPPEAVAEMEVEAIRDVGQIAKLHAERLPARSEWKAVLERLAISFSEDEARLQLVSSEDSGQAAVAP